MSDAYTDTILLPDLHLWERAAEKRVPLSIDLEVTARCNNDCRHCYINLPAGDAAARAKELSLKEINAIADQAVSLGSLWCLITGGEPLLREDFSELYLSLRKKGLLITVFTNACLVTDEHVRLFRSYPPRDIEVTMYGADRETYERVTRRPGSYDAFRRGLDMLLRSGVKVRLKAMVMRSNVHELPAIARFCREHTRDYFLFDPLLNLRCDYDSRRNEEIRAERLSPEEIVAVEQADEERAATLEKMCQKLHAPENIDPYDDHLFFCGAGLNSFSISYDGMFRLCSALNQKDCLYDLRAGSLADAWLRFAPRIIELRSQEREFLEKCKPCPLVNLCLWCPAHAHLETGRLDGATPYFCAVAHARAALLQGERSRQ
jgi:radical SAM protein with 4Fe4S-binding SPASM domain